MKVAKAETKESTQHRCGDGYRPKDSAEHEGQDAVALIEPRTTENNTTNADTDRLLEEILRQENMDEACKQVHGNHGASGVDRMTVDDLLRYLSEHRTELEQSLLAGKYKPAPVRRVEIPKDNGKKRMLGIPTAVDRVIQQAIAQVLTPIYEPEFVETSYGFRPGRSGHDAIRKCLEYLNEGYTWAVDMDLEKFFDTVNQSKLIEVLSRKIKDGRVISLIHKFLRAGAVWCGRFEETTQGVPQGGPLSPLCANILLNELDHELERRGHKFVRYADDMVIFCKSEASAKQTLEHIIPYIERKLFLKVNREKTMVDRATRVKYLGYAFYWNAGKKEYRPRLHEKTKEKFRAKVRELTSRRTAPGYKEWKQKLWEYVRGWVNYYKLADMKAWLEEQDKWMRHRIRMVIWKRWKRIRTKYENLRECGIEKEDAIKTANTRKAYWRMASSPVIHRAMSNQNLARMGYPSFLSYYESVRA